MNTEVQTVVPGTEEHFAAGEKDMGSAQINKRERKRGPSTPRKPSKKVQAMLATAREEGVMHGMNLDAGRMPLWLPLLTAIIGALIGKFLLH